jgi:hypothetical protein
MSSSHRGGPDRPGGVEGYPIDRLHQEVAYIAYHFHWPLHDILSLEHEDRRRWVEEIAGINSRLTQGVYAQTESDIGE